MKSYKITDIVIKNIYADTKNIHLGFDSEDMSDSEMFGKQKKYILSILVYLDFLETINC